MPGIDFNETFAPTVRRESLRIFLPISAILGLIIHQVDIVGAYLESLLGDNEDSIYMRPPPSINHARAGLYCRLLKSLYGLKQYGRLWNKNVIRFFTSIRFMQFNGDASIMIWHEEDGGVSMISIYVNDFLIASDKLATLQSIKAALSNEYNVKDLGETKTIIGWQVTRDIEKGTLKIEQSAYI